MFSCKNRHIYNFKISVSRVCWLHFNFLIFENTFETLQKSFKVILDKLHFHIT
eukprot:UN28409